MTSVCCKILLPMGLKLPRRREPFQLQLVFPCPSLQRKVRKNRMKILLVFSKQSHLSLKCRRRSLVNLKKGSKAFRQIGRPLHPHLPLSSRLLPRRPFHRLQRVWAIHHRIVPRPHHRVFPAVRLVLPPQRQAVAKKGKERAPRKQCRPL